MRFIGNKTALLELGVKSSSALTIIKKEKNIINIKHNFFIYITSNN